MEETPPSAAGQVWQVSDVGVGIVGLAWSPDRRWALLGVLCVL